MLSVAHMDSVTTATADTKALSACMGSDEVLPLFLASNRTGYVQGCRASRRRYIRSIKWAGIGGRNEPTSPYVEVGKSIANKKVVAVPGDRMKMDVSHVRTTPLFDAVVG